MRDLLDQAQELLREGVVRDILRALAIFLTAWLVSRLLRRRLNSEHLRAQHRMLLRRIVAGVVWGVAIAWALAELGLNVGVVLGAAGVLTVAIGFASQTSVSNLISGVFLTVERPFEVEDLIEVGGTTGEVIAIDLLSTKLRTLDNRLVRIPNETLFKSAVINFTHFPIRRYDMQLSVARHVDLPELRQLLVRIAEEHPLCLHEPMPKLWFMTFGEYAHGFQFSVWSTRDNYIEMRSSLHEAITVALAERGIELPYPHRTLNATDALPVRLVDDGDAQAHG